MNPVGYFIWPHKGPLIGEPGSIYTYHVHGNGVFIASVDRMLEACIPIAPCDIRGLRSVPTSVALVNGKIPMELFHLAVKMFKANPDHEVFLAIRWTGDKYDLVMPTQVASGVHVDHEKVPDTVLELHSHCNMEAFFSGTDTRDEQGFGLFGVVGKIGQETPEYQLRVGIYGYFYDLNLEEVFE